MTRQYKIISSIILGIVISSWNISPAASSSPDTDTSTPIHHLIVVMQQNHTYDNYFGTYPRGAGLPPETCMPVSLSDPTNNSCIAPFYIDERPLSDLSHGSRTFVELYNDGLMNGFIEAQNRRNQDGPLAMAYFDDQDIPYYWNLADEFVLFDNYFSSAHSGSIMNRLFWTTGTPGDGTNNIPPNGYGDITTIFDRLEERGISWKFYINNYDPTLNYRSLAELTYLPPQIQWVPLLGMDRFLDDSELSSHIVDLEEYYEDLNNGTLPAVSYVLLLGATEHPISDVGLGQRVTRTMIQTLMQSDAWDNSAFFITYDDWGGWYDHVPPPQVDEYGLGFRVPALLVSAYARKGHIDHTQLEHTSFLKFIEENWGIPPLATRDAQANNFLSAFDFTMPPHTPKFISSSRVVSEPRAEPRRIAVYVTYGAAMVFALFILVRVRRLSKRRTGYMPSEEKAGL
jgi:phospholipase C